MLTRCRPPARRSDLRGMFLQNPVMHLAQASALFQRVVVDKAWILFLGEVNGNYRFG